MRKKPEEVKKRTPVVIQCFGFEGYRCNCLNVIVPTECGKCKFKKLERDVTNGKRYPNRESNKHAES